MNYTTTTIKKIEELKKESDSLPPIKKEDESKLQKKYRLEFNYNSNHIEGNTLTYGQTQLLLFFNKSSGDVSVSDIEEMQAHDVALSQIQEMSKDQERPLTEQFIRELNKIILVRPYWKDARTADGISTRKKIEIGAYKKTPNSVQLRNGEFHEYTSPEDTPAKMNDLMAWYNNNLNKMHSAQIAAEFHYRFVCIHPFDDGNGRVARLIMNYILLRAGYPPVIIKSDDKEKYLTALQKADTGNLSEIIEYVEKQLIWSLELKIKATKGEDIEESGDIKKEIEILKRDKLTKSKIFKTPKVVYELVQFIDDDVWSSLSQALNYFNEFFAETKTEVFLNHSKVLKTKTVRHPLKAIFFEDREEVVKPYEIFGYDLDDRDLLHISWERNMLSLKSATKKIDYFINLCLRLNEASYKLEVGIRNLPDMININNLFQEEREYKSFLMKDEIDKIVKIVSKHLINAIKEQE